MPFREPAPDGAKDADNLPLHVLPEGSLLKDIYRVRYLTAGGMSIAYSAVKDGERYFIKEVDASESKNVLSITQEKFMLERLTHPSVVKAHDLFEQDGFYYLVLDFIDGESLDRLISPHPDVFIQEKIIINWATQICDIFEYLHRQSPPIIYRDLKPRNLIKDRQGRVHLVDFGIARVFKQGKSRDTEAMGSALTASPEHYGGIQTDERSDIFTLGATLHFLITNGRGSGDEPFRFAPVRSINPRSSANLEQVIRKSLELEPAKRYQSVKELRQALLNSREAPLPVIEPLGEKEKEEFQEKAGPSTGESISISSPVLWGAGVLALIAIVLFLALLMKPQQNYPVTPPLLSASTEASQQAPVTATTMIIYASTPLPPEPTPELNREPSPFESLPPSAPPPHPSPVKTRAMPVVPPPLPGGPSLYPSGTPGSRPQSGALAIITPESMEDPKGVGETRLYRDTGTGYELTLTPGWRIDRQVLGIEQRKDPNVSGAFTFSQAQSPDTMPLAILVIQMTKPRPGVTDPAQCIEEWVTHDEEQNRIVKRLSMAPASDENNGYLRASMDVLVHLLSYDLVQTRQVCMDREKKNLAYIKCYLRIRNPARMTRLRNAPSTVLDSFTFLN